MTDEERQRYARHLLLDGFDEAAQQRLLDATVLVVGCGGLGSPALLYLAAAGVGHLMLADADTVDRSNLQRQIAHSDARIGVNKAESAASAARALNPGVRITALPHRATADTLPAWVEQADAVLDCSDNYATRQAVNAACVAAGKPLLWAAAVGWSAQAAAYDPTDAGSPCYACLFPPEAPVADVACAVMGVFAPLVGQAGLLQAGEALRLLAGLSVPLSRKLWMLDGHSQHSELLGVAPLVDCPVCSERRKKIKRAAG